MYTLILNEAIRVVSVLTSIFEDVFIEFVEEVAESVPHDVIVRASGLSRPHTTHAVPHILCNVTVILLISQNAAISQQDWGSPRYSRSMHASFSAMRNRSSLKSTTIVLMRAVQLVVVGSVTCEG